MKRFSEITVVILTGLLSASHAASIYWFEDIKSVLSSPPGFKFIDATPFIAFAFSLIWIVRPAMDELGVVSIAGTLVFLSAFVGDYGNYLVQEVWPADGFADFIEALDAVKNYGLYCLYASFAAACLTIILCVWTLYLLAVKAENKEATNLNVVSAETEKATQICLYTGKHTVNINEEEKSTEATPENDNVSETVAVVDETETKPKTETETVTVTVAVTDQEIKPEPEVEPQVEPEPEPEPEPEL